MNLSLFVLVTTITSSTTFALSKVAPSVIQLFSTTEAPQKHHHPPPHLKTPIFCEVYETTGVTLTRFMTKVAMLNPELSKFTTLFSPIDTSYNVATFTVNVDKFIIPSKAILTLDEKD